MNYRYYSNLDKIILKSRRKRQMRRYAENAKEAVKFALGAAFVWGGFYFVWSLTSYVFPGW